MSSEETVKITVVLTGSRWSWRAYRATVSYGPMKQEGSYYARSLERAFARAVGVTARQLALRGYERIEIVRYHGSVR